VRPPLAAIARNPPRGRASGGQRLGSRECLGIIKSRSIVDIWVVCCSQHDLEAGFRATCGQDVGLVFHRLMVIEPANSQSMQRQEVGGLLEATRTIWTCSSLHCRQEKRSA